MIKHRSNKPSRLILKKVFLKKQIILVKCLFRYVPNSGNYDNWESIHLHLHSLSFLDNDKEHRAEDAHSSRAHDPTSNF